MNSTALGRQHQFMQQESEEEMLHDRSGSLKIAPEFLQKSLSTIIRRFRPHFYTDECS